MTLNQQTYLVYQLRVGYQLEEEPDKRVNLKFQRNLLMPQWQPTAGMYSYCNEVV